MKKILIVLVFLGFAVVGYGQSRHYDGIGAGPKATATADGYVKRLIANITTNKITFYDSQGDKLTPDPNAADVIDGSTVYVTQIPDTVQHTSNFTLALTDLNKDLYCIKATSIVITIPLSSNVAVPIGTTINFYGEGAGIMVFHGASAGVHLHSDKDSIATSRQHQVVSLKKRGNNYWILYGALTD